MHRDIINNIIASNKQNLIITSSIDGHIKFWKKTFSLIEFIKNFKAHTGLITSISLNKNHDMLVSIGVDKTLKIFDVLNCDLRTVVKLNFSPSDCDWIPQKGFDWQLLAIA
jgi:peptidylprolyl isomerase domain and WD repeat-containing protein 1